MKSSRIAPAVVAGAFLLAACSGDGSSDDKPAAATQSSQVTAVVDTSKSGCDVQTAKKDGNCWLPLYAGSGLSTRVINLGGDCTRDDERACWPQPGEKLAVACGQPGDKEIHDNTGRTSKLWIGVAIPKHRVVAPTYSPELDDQGRAVVFASAVWLKLEGTGTFPSCTQLFTETNDF